MRRWPWITTLAAAVAAVSPFGQDLLRQSFWSGEQLARSLGQFLLMVGVAILLLLGLLEWGIRVMIRRRRARVAAARVTDGDRLG